MREYIKLIWVGLLLLVAGNAFSVSATAVRDTVRQEYTKFPAYRLRTPEEKLMRSYREDVSFNYTRQKSEMPEWLQRCIDWIAEHLFGVRYSSGDAVMPEWWEILLRVGAVAILVFIVYKVVRSKYRLPFGRRKKNFPAEPVLEIPENVDENSYAMWLERAISSKDFSLAVRIHYLYILFLLDRNGLISWDKRKTNVTYLYEIKDEQVKNVFKELSWIFDCVCYGDFAIGESAFQRIEIKFKAFQKEIGG